MKYDSESEVVKLSTSAYTDLWRYTELLGLKTLEDLEGICFKILMGFEGIKEHGFFFLVLYTQTRGHSLKLCKERVHCPME
jgi:hypothetical protein